MSKTNGVEGHNAWILECDNQVTSYPEGKPFDYPCENSKQVRDEFINHAKKFKI